MDSMSKKDLSHTPFVIILYTYVKRWQQLNTKADNELPVNYNEKSQLKKLISDGSEQFKLKFLRTEDNEESRELDLDNFQEAIKAVNTVLVNSQLLPSKIKQLFELANTTKSASKFWLMVKALEEYVKVNGSLPLRGTLPDMTADSERYINLQKVYATRAKQDANMFHDILQVSFSCDHSKSSHTIIAHFF